MFRKNKCNVRIQYWSERRIEEKTGKHLTRPCFLVRAEAASYHDVLIRFSVRSDVKRPADSALQPERIDGTRRWLRASAEGKALAGGFVDDSLGATNYVSPAIKKDLFLSQPWIFLKVQQLTVLPNERSILSCVCSLQLTFILQQGN